jgi:hypothetical protein
MPRHKQLELLAKNEPDREKKAPESIPFYTSHLGKLSVSSTPMSFDLVLEILKPVFADTNSEQKS